MVHAGISFIDRGRFPCLWYLFQRVGHSDWYFEQHLFRAHLPCNSRDLPAHRRGQGRSVVGMGLGSLSVFHPMASSVDLGNEPLRATDGLHLLSDAANRRFIFDAEFCGLRTPLGTCGQHQPDAPRFPPRSPLMDLAAPNGIATAHAWVSRSSLRLCCFPSAVDRPQSTGDGLYRIARQLWRGTLPWKS